jgi:hypothetical protein
VLGDDESDEDVQPAPPPEQYTEYEGDDVSTCTPEAVKVTPCARAMSDAVTINVSARRLVLNQELSVLDA